MATKPKLIVFDLDYTLWPFYADAYLTTPLRKEKDGFVYDANNSKFELYPDSKDILQHLHTENYRIAIASRTSEIEGAKQLVKLHGLKKFISMKEIYPGKKTTHFAKFHEKLKIPYSEMLFFDDEDRNIRDLRACGVKCVFVKNGMTWETLKKGMNLFQSKEADQPK